MALAAGRFNQFCQAPLTVQECGLPKVLTVEPEQIKRVQNRLGLPCEKLIEPTHALRVEADNLAVNDRALHGEFCKGFLQGLEAKVALVSRNDLTLAALQIEQPFPGKCPACQAKASADSSGNSAHFLFGEAS
jgi:hypothetical protein